MLQPGIEFDRVQEAAQYIEAKMPFTPKVGIILGTGLGEFLDKVEVEQEIHTVWIPNMIPPSVVSHRGRLCFAHVEGVPTVILAGRVHHYEGHDLVDVVRPIRVLRTIGCTHVLATNAAGGLNADFNEGDLVFVRDHINLMNAHPLRGPNEDRWGSRFPDMLNAYDPDWIQYAEQKATSAGIQVRKGVYAGVSGPSLETAAEYEFLHRIGADLVGMSAVPEVIAAHHIGLRVMVISVVSNACYPLSRLRSLTVEEVIANVRKKETEVENLIRLALPFVRH